MACRCTAREKATQPGSVAPGTPVRRAHPTPRASNQAHLGRLQAKLTVGAVNDPLEREADAAADRVMRMSDPQIWHPAPKTLTPKCTACAEEANTVQRDSDPSRSGCEQAPQPFVDQVLASEGRELDATTRDFMCDRFGVNFGNVRIHVDAEAARSAAAVHARAYTVGRDIVFGKRQYQPYEREGRRLIAHELAHVIQQHSNIPSASVLQREELDKADLQAETEDDADEVYDGDSPVVASSAVSDSTEEQSAPQRSESRQDAALQGRPLQPSDRSVALDDANKEQPKKAPPSKITVIDVDQEQQSMTITWSDGSTEVHPVSTGKGRPNTTEDPCKDQTEENCTPNGDFTVGVLGDGDTKNGHGDKMSWYVEFVHRRGIGIHNSQPVPGIPASHGCVRVGNSNAADALAKKINRNVVPGKTKITVHGKAPTKPWVKAKPKTKAKKK